MMVQAKQRVEARGPVNTCVGTIYKNAPMADGQVDPLTADGIHMVDVLRWIAGAEARSVTSCVSAYDDQAPNTYHALIRFENDATGILRTGWAAGGRLRTVEMHTRGMSAFLNADAEAVFVSSERSAGTSDPPRTEVVTTQEMSGSDEFHRYYGYYDESRHFMECIRTGRRPMTNLDDAVRSMALLDEIYHNSI
jgi:virulence factor